MTTWWSCGVSAKVPQPPPVPLPICCVTRPFTSGSTAITPEITLLGGLTMRSPNYLHAPPISLTPNFNTHTPPATDMANVDLIQKHRFLCSFRAATKDIVKGLYASRSASADTQWTNIVQLLCQHVPWPTTTVLQGPQINPRRLRHWVLPWRQQRQR